ncbi:MAG: hypothetical protein JW940_23845 [Polyangiaceae bacterium]|nr:hypothetical protein [Polyangiaceae bacterium]
MRRLPLAGSLCLALALNVVACGDDDDDSSNNDGFAQTGGTGGTAATTGGSATGGTATGGTPGTTGGSTGTTGGTPGTTGGSSGTTGGASGTTGGTPGTTGGSSGTTGGSSGTTGGASGTTGGSSGTTGGGGGTGGAPGEAGAGGAVPTGGSTNVAGAGGVAGTAGGGPGTEAGAGGAGTCSGYVKLFAAFAAQGDAVELSLSLGETPVDLSATTIAVHLKVLEPNAGGVQAFAKNGEALGYKSAYAGWTDLVASPDWQDVTLNLAEVEAVGAGGAGGAGPEPVFDKSQVSTVGLQVTTGDHSPFAGGATILVDSITLSDHPELNADFATEDPELAVSGCGTICDSSSLTWQECE